MSGLRRALARALVPAGFFAGGLAAAITVTRRLHHDPTAGIWGERLGRTRLRYANLPVGGTLALVASRFVPATVVRSVRALGSGALLGAVAWGVVDPLPAFDDDAGQAAAS